MAARPAGRARPVRGLRTALGALLAVLVVAIAPVASAAPAHADSIRLQEYWLDDYGFTTAWDTTLGAGATVAVIDTGVDGSVPELRGAVVDGTDVSGLGSPDGQTPVGEFSQHGTMVASMIAGRGTGEGNGVIGVAPEASILAISVALGDGSPGSDDQIADAVRWAVDHGADVINMSLTRNSLDWPESWDDAFSYAFDNDVVVVAAAGNRINGTSEVGAPATIPGVVAVAGVDEAGDASFDASSQGITIAVAAPSEQLVGVVPGGGYVIWDGTSGAAPLVSGLAALVKAAHPELDAANVINRIIATATPKGEPVPGPIYGYGLIDAAAAVRAEVPPVTANPIGDLAAWIATYRPSSGTVSVDTLSIPAPTSTPSPAPVAAPADETTDVYALVHWAVPLGLLLGFLILLAVLALGAAAQFRRLLRK